MTDENATEIQPPKILPPHYLLMALVLMISTLWLDLSAMLGDMWPWCGAIFALAGLSVAGWAARQFFQAKTNIIPLTHSDALVVTGVFSFTRNPMYLGMVLLLFGVAILVNNWLALLVLPVFYFIIRRLFIAREEVLMLATFGEEYTAYCKTVRRWV